MFSAKILILYMVLITGCRKYAVSKICNSIRSHVSKFPDLVEGTIWHVTFSFAVAIIENMRGTTLCPGYFILPTFCRYFSMTHKTLFFL